MIAFAPLPLGLLPLPLIVVSFIGMGAAGAVVGCVIPFVQVCVYMCVCVFMCVCFHECVLPATCVSKYVYMRVPVFWKPKLMISVTVTHPKGY